LGKIAEIALSSSGRKQLEVAENLARRFLKWKPMEETEIPARERLQEMIKEVDHLI
jgi:hypothetical protein